MACVIGGRLEVTAWYDDECPEARRLRLVAGQQVLHYYDEPRAVNDDTRGEDVMPKLSLR